MTFSPRTRNLTALAVICFLCFFFRLGSVGLFDFNEGQYTEAAREMYLHGDFVTPRVDGRFFFDKPPLSLWLSAISFHVFGRSELAARLPVAVAATLLVGLTYWFGARFLGRRAGLLSAAALALNPLFFGTARQNTMDIHQSLWFGVAMFCFYLGYTAKTARGRWWYMGLWLGCGLSWLAKSIPGLFPLAAAFVFVVADAWRERRPAEPLARTAHRVLARVWESKPWLGLPVLVLAIAPWVVLAYRANGHVFYEQFWLLHHVKLADGADFNHVQPVWYYLPALLGGMFPWSLFLIAAVVLALSELRSRQTPALAGAGETDPGRIRGREPRERELAPVREADRRSGGVAVMEAPAVPAVVPTTVSGRLATAAVAGAAPGAAAPSNAVVTRLFLLVWTAVVVLVFSAMTSKLVSYLLPMYAAAALLVGDWLSRAIDAASAREQRGAFLRPLRVCATLVAVLAVIALAGGAVAAHRVETSPSAVNERRAVPPAVLDFGVHALALCAVGLTTAAVLTWRRNRRATVAGIWAMAATAAAFVALADTEGLSAMQAGLNGPLQSLATAAGRTAAAGTPLGVYIGGPTRPSVLFYLPDPLFLSKPLPKDGSVDSDCLVLDTGDRPVIDRFLSSTRPALVLTDRRRAGELLASTPGLAIRRSSSDGQWLLLRAAPAARATAR